MATYCVRSLALGLAAALSLAACGGGGSDPSEPGPEPLGLLRPVSSAAELEASLKAGFTTLLPAQPADPTAGEGAGAPSGGSYSRTYTQELEVDEFDTVKYDGEYLFVAPMRQSFPCCFAVPVAGGGAAPPTERSIRILQTDPATAGATVVGAIALPDDVSVQGLFRTDDRLVAITSTTFFGTFGDAWAWPEVWAPERSGLAFYDTSDISAPALVFEASFDGTFIESRRIGDTIYVVSRYAPFLEGLDYYVTSTAQQAANAALLAEVSLAELLPSITVNGETRSLVAPEDCYVPAEEPPAYPVITSITAIPVDDPEAFTTTCYNDDAYGVYVSPNAMYFAQSRDEGEGTRLHKFSLGADAPAYAGSADIDGIVWTGGQADFRLSEHDGDLRVFASRFDPSGADFVDHHLYVLREAASGPALEVVAELPNDVHPEEIGKPNEQLYGVRFLGDRAYAVTFERIDPLYVFDLSDPTDPRIAGTLEITGFSDFLHPVSDALLLGLGTSEDNAIKLELFDVSDLARPLSVGSDILGGPGSWSEATYDRHAFTYLADVDGLDRFTLPADLTSSDGSFTPVESGLYLYEIHDKATPATASLQRAGSVIVHRPDDGGWQGFSARSRAVLHDDAVYYVRDDQVWSTLWGTPEVVGGPH